MRHTTIAAACLALALSAPNRARAQEEDQGAQDQEQGQEQEGAETEGAEVVDQGVKKGPKAGGKDVAPGEVHTVTKGDTLWDLSQRYLGNAWYWPKVWSYNPEIANPHWIYPGNQVRFFPEAGAEEAPTEVEKGEGPATPLAQGTELGEVEPGTELPEQVGVEVVAPIQRPQTRAMTVGREVFVTQHELDESGKITGSFAESLMLSEPDEVYVKFRRAEARVGDRYLIFNTEREVAHPKTGFRFGYVTHLLGTARVVKAGQPVVTLRIEKAWDEIHRGDLIGPFGEQISAQVAPRPNERDVKGYVLALGTPQIQMAAEFQTIFIDKGSGDGVQVGNEFIVTRQAEMGGELRNPSRSEDRDLPIEDIALCMVTDVKETASTCLLKRSIREVYPGDHAEMRKNKTQPVSLR